MNFMHFSESDNLMSNGLDLLGVRGEKCLKVMSQRTSCRAVCLVTLFLRLTLHSAFNLMPNAVRIVSHLFVFVAYV